MYQHDGASLLFQAKQLDVDACMAMLMQVDTKLSALMGVPESSHWKTNFISAPTFFENKTGKQGLLIILCIYVL